MCVYPTKVLLVRYGCFSFSDLQKSGFQNWSIAHIPFPQTHASLCQGSGWLKCCQVHASLVTESPSSSSLENHFKSSFSMPPLPPKTHLRVSFTWEFWNKWLPVQVWSYLTHRWWWWDDCQHCTGGKPQKYFTRHSVCASCMEAALLTSESNQY